MYYYLNNINDLYCYLYFGLWLTESSWFKQAEIQYNYGITK